MGLKMVSVRCRCKATLYWLYKFIDLPIGLRYNYQRTSISIQNERGGHKSG